MAQWMVVTLPKDASSQLPSRGTVMVKGVIKDLDFRAPLEPDGKGSHWFRLSRAMGKALNVVSGDVITVELEATKLWPEPEVPADLQKALTADHDAHDRWVSVTPMARWEWIRWAEAVKLAETRKERPQKLCSMLKSGKRRPCCFNRAMFTPPKVAEPISS